MSRTRNWCFTLNNYTEEDVSRLSVEDKQIRYLIFGKELGDKEQTPHLQGFVIFYNQKTFNQVKKFFGDRFHIESCQGTPQQNIAYCSKDEEYVEYGEPPHQGARKDIQEVKEMVKSGKSLRQIYESATSYQSIRMAEIGMKLQPLKERDKPLVKWYYGDSGTGKTYTATKELGYDNTWISNDTLQWFDGYDGQENVIIDDFRAHTIKYSLLLRVLDRYPLRLPVKGGYVNWIPKTIIITSCHHPRNVYKSEDIQESIEQLIRRIDIIQEFKK